MAKKESTSKRLAGWRAFAREVRLWPKLPRDRALQLDPTSKRDLTIIAAFEAFRLDHRDPIDWRTLMIYFADVHFGKSQRGPRRQWTVERLCQLSTDFDAMKQRHADAPAEHVCRLLIKAKDGRYREFKPATLRRQLPVARAASRRAGDLVAARIKEAEARFGR
jgi:hypothetical protein